MNGRWGSRPTLSTEAVALLASLYFATVSSRIFWQAAMQEQAGFSSWRFGVLLLLALVCLNLCLLCLLLTRRTTAVLLTVLFLVTACATHFMQAYGVYLTPGMLRNVVHSEPKEAADLIGVGLFLRVLSEGAAPAALLWAIRLRKFPTAVAAARRVGVLAISLCLLSVAVLLAYQDLAPLMRNQKEMRYLITPANYLYSLARVVFTHVPADPGALIEVGADARRGSTPPERRPVLFVIVVGETARSANWGLNGYGRQTTPELSRLDVINFTSVTACGSDTETSLPCMFSAVGRRDYDESRIRNSESLLHVLQRAGFSVLWRDNQTGCKGVCAGLAYAQADDLRPDLCAHGACFDEVLLDGVAAFAREKSGDKVVVLHQIGNHGPAYHHRYPDRFRRFMPTCDTGEIRQCSIQDIVNSYDNALLYTDYFLSRTIRLLKEQEDYDTAMLYVSDHGESLGEHGLFLHGIPYGIAPDTQTRVPMVLWLSAGLRASYALDEACIRRRQGEPLSHDHLFHTVLGLLAVETRARNPNYDLASDCRRPDPATIGAGAGAAVH